MQRVSDLIHYVREVDHPRPIEMVDLRFSDLWGVWHHVTLPVERLNESLLTEGVAFDGSSLGFKSVGSGDMVLIPDVSTALYDPFWEIGTVGLICNVHEAGTLKPCDLDPRTMAQRAEALVAERGLADRSLWGPEFEFYIFDKVIYRSDINLSYYRIDSEEADWSTDAEQGRNLGAKIPRQGGYHAMPPFDRNYQVRAEMARHIEQAGVPVRYHHHEVGGPGQSEIEINLLPLLRAADAVMLVKYLTRMVARQHNKTVTYMPKPLWNEAGSGMHFHQMLTRGDRSMFFEEGAYGGLGQLGRWYVGGLLRHGRALVALTNPSTNSYKRLVPGFEAPVSLVYGLANRSAAVRIPKYVANPQAMRVEFRPPDGTCNPYLSMAAQLLAGLDGIAQKIDPEAEGFGPFDANLFTLPPEELSRIQHLPASLKESLEALRQDCGFLTESGVFTQEVIERWCRHKLEKEFEAVRNRPHPFEMSLYFDC